MKSNYNSQIAFLKKKKKKKSDSDSDKLLRDKDEELKKDIDFLKNYISKDTLEAIKNNPEKIKEIIKGLKNNIKAISKDVELKKLKETQAEEREIYKN